MHRALTIAEIMRYTGLKRRTIERVLSVHRNTGGVWPRSHGRRSMAGRNQILSDDEIAVSSFVYHTSALQSQLISSLCSFLLASLIIHLASIWMSFVMHWRMRVG